MQKFREKSCKKNLFELIFSILIIVIVKYKVGFYPKLLK